MTPSQQAKAAGLKNLRQVQQLTGQSAQTLTNWHRDKPELFKIVIRGCVASLKETDPPYPVGTRIKQGVIDRIYEHAPNTYAVQVDGEKSNHKLLVKFEISEIL